MNAVLVTKVDYDVDIDPVEDCPYTQELMCVFVDDENYTADAKAADYIKYVTEHNDTYEVDGETYPTYDIRHVRCY